MPSQPKPQFVNDEFYHVYNRGVEKRDIFREDLDYLRFIHDMYEFNNEDFSAGANVRFSCRKPKIADEKSISLTFLKERDKKPRKLLVDIVAFCLMPNHFHIVMRQKIDGGLIKFMMKIGSGYASYFNLKNDRVGPLFQGTFKAKHINQQEYFDYLLFYLHFNPLDLIEEDWRSGEAKDYSKLKDYLNSYRWSSHLDYSGQKNFPSVTKRDFYLDLLKGEEGYSNQLENWMKAIPEKIKFDNFEIRIEKD
ncbi:MAG: transposase [Candidatus Paceibacterota bacterium]